MLAESMTSYYGWDIPFSFLIYLHNKNAYCKWAHTFTVAQGCTGFTGTLTARYLHAEYGKKLKIGLAGRESSRLKALQEKFGLDGMDILVATVNDVDSLRRLTGSTSCLLSTAGPFARVGLPVVDACVQTGTHYVDITGEPQFVRAVIDQHHEEATKKGIKIVPCCGFDCIPSDFGCQMMVETMKARGLHPLEVLLNSSLPHL